MADLFPYTFRLSRWSRAEGLYEVLGRDFDSLILRGGEVLDGSVAVHDVDSLLADRGICVEMFVDMVGPESQKITWNFTLNGGEALPLGVVWYVSDFVSGGGDSRGTCKKMVTWISLVDGSLEERVEAL